MPIKNILASCTSEPVYVFWDDEEKRFLGHNDRYGESIKQFTGCKNVIGKSYSDLFSWQETQTINKNNDEVIRNKNLQIFIETGFNREFLAFKIPTKNSANQFAGIFGMAFCLDEINLSNTLNIINRLNLLSYNSNLKSSSIMPCFINHQNLPVTNREKECIHYLLRGMTAKGIARALNISNRTVECHIEHIKYKLGCHNRSQIISKILENN